MARRKRLTPPQPGFLDAGTASGTASGRGTGAGTSPGPAPAIDLAAPSPAPARAPIAQVAGDSAASAALEELATELEAARRQGRLARLLPLDAIDAGYLVRDRLALEEEPLDELVASLRARGQRTPVEVVDLGADAAPRFGLISGWRRLAALRLLAREDPAFGHVAAIVRAPETAAEAYLSMVEENEIRLGLSYYERARVVVQALDAWVFNDERVALQTLFGNVSRSKRSKIRSFMEVVRAFDEVLRFPAAISERLGLDLAAHLKRPGAAEALRTALAARPAATAEEEIARLQAALPAPVAPPARARPPAAPPADGPDARAPLGAVALRWSDDGLTLAGPGVDDDLRHALATWLRRRGHPER